MTGVILMAVITIALPIAVLIILAIRKKGYATIFLAGALIFFLAQNILRVPLMQMLTANIGWFASFQLRYPYLYIVFMALTSGIFEEAGKYGGLLLVSRKREEWFDSVALGLGHGMMEALQIGASSILFYFVASGVVGYYIAALERVIAVVFHVGAAMLVYYGIKEKKRWGLGTAVLLHTVFEAAILLLEEFSGNDIVIELVSMMIAAGTLALGIYLLKVRAGRIPAFLVRKSGVE